MKKTKTKSNKPDGYVFGRPTDYKPEYCEMLIEHGESGLSFEAFAGVIGTTFKTLYTWADKHPEFLQAKKEFEAKSRVFWEKEGIEGLWSTSTRNKDGSTTSKSLNASVWIFNMKNRHKWRDKIETSEVDSFDDVEFYDDKEDS